MRLIDADALKEQVLLTMQVYKTNGKFDEPLARFCKLLKEEIKAIDHAPTIEPVKHGEWKYYNYSDLSNPYCGYNECSICKQHEHIVHKFCPNCGAKMDK